jgi:hypothetical protein
MQETEIIQNAPAADSAQSLLDQLANATQPPAPPVMDILGGSPSNMPEGFEPSTGAFEDDFEPAPPPEPEAGTTATGEALVAVTYPPEKLAATLIDVADVLLVHVMPALYLKSLDPKDAKALKILGKKVSQKLDAKQDILLSIDEQNTMGLSADFEAYKDSLPLAPEEKKTILGPLKEVLKDAKYETTPTNALLMALGVIMLPRTLPVIANKMSK